MPSELKSETARANGAKSHGPKTSEGKEASCLNAIKHGLTANHTLILKCESPEEFQAMLAEHIAIHQPVTPPEKELVDQMAIARWRIRRFVAAETDLIDSQMVRNREKVNKEFAPTDSGVHLAMYIRSLADESRALSLMSRYESPFSPSMTRPTLLSASCSNLEPTAQASARGRTLSRRPLRLPDPTTTQASARGLPPKTKYR
jgi:hypothetical protein